MLRQIRASGLADQFCRCAHLKHIVKAHKQKGVKHDVNIIQIVKLAI